MNLKKDPASVLLKALGEKSEKKLRKKLEKELRKQRFQEQMLVDAHGLLDALFDKESRPSLRWVRQMQAQRKFPYVKIGHLVRFKIPDVRKALEENCTVYPRSR